MWLQNLGASCAFTLRFQPIIELLKKRSSNHKVIYKEAFYVQEEATISDKTTYNFLKWMKKKSFKLKKIDKNKRESILRKP